MLGLGHDVVDVPAFTKQLNQPGTRMRNLFSMREIWQKPPHPAGFTEKRAKKHKQASIELNSENRRYTAMALSKKKK